MDIQTYLESKLIHHGFAYCEPLYTPMDIDTPCGRDCKRIIDAAAALIAGIEGAHGYREKEFVMEVIQQTQNAVRCYVHG
jgi:hypothetical protein